MDKKLNVACTDGVFSYEYEGIHNMIDVPIPFPVRLYDGRLVTEMRKEEPNWTVRLGFEIDPECEVYRGFYVQVGDDYSADEDSVTGFGIDPLSKELAERYQIAVANWMIICTNQASDFTEFVALFTSQFKSWAIDVDLKEEKGDFGGLDHVLDFILKYYNNGILMEQVDKTATSDEVLKLGSAMVLVPIEAPKAFERDDRKVYEVTFDVTGGGTQYVLAKNPRQAYEILCNSEINASDYLDGIEVVEPTEDNEIPDKHIGDWDDIITENGKITGKDLLKGEEQ